MTAGMFWWSSIINSFALIIFDKNILDCSTSHRTPPSVHFILKSAFHFVFRLLYSLQRSLWYKIHFVNHLNLFYRLVHDADCLELLKVSCNQSFCLVNNPHHNQTGKFIEKESNTMVSQCPICTFYFNIYYSNISICK